MNSEDMSDILGKLNNVIDKDKISPEMVNNLMNMFNQSNQEKSNDTSNESSGEIPSIDIETIMKIKMVMEKMNSKDDPRSKLLQSLKPYLKESRKNKVDQYIQLLNMEKIMGVLPFLGGEKKGNGN